MKNSTEVYQQLNELRSKNLNSRNALKNVLTVIEHDELRSIANRAVDLMLVFAEELKSEISENLGFEARELTHMPDWIGEGLNTEEQVFEALYSGLKKAEKDYDDFLYDVMGIPQPTSHILQKHSRAYLELNENLLELEGLLDMTH